ncbi:MAG: murein biosynthesis integral membrane protein MurJ, partial [Candidatus Zipacnadales bacterium]
NLVIIAGALASLPIAHYAGLYEPKAMLPYRLMCLATFVVLGAAIGNTFIQIPPLVKLGAKLQPVLDLRDEGLQKVAVLAAPVILGLAISEINFVVSTSIATMCGERAASLLEYPNRILKLPPRMFGAGVAMAIFPTLATYFAQGDMVRYRRDLARMLRSSIFLSIPSAVITATLAVALIRLLFEGRSFGPEDTQGTAQVLLWSSFGITPLSVQYIVSRGFYALHETKTPLYVGLASGVLNVALSLAVYRPLGVAGLAAVYSVSCLFNALVTGWLLRRRVGPLQGQTLAAMLLRMTLPCIALGVVCNVGSAGLAVWLGTAGVMSKLVACIVPLVAGLAIFAALCVILDVKEFYASLEIVAARFRQRKSAAA